MAQAPRLLQVLSHELRGPLLTLKHLGPALLDALHSAPQAQAWATDALREAEDFHGALWPMLQAPPEDTESALADWRARLWRLKGLTQQAASATAKAQTGPAALAPELAQAGDWLRQLADQWGWMQSLLDEALPAAWSALSFPLQVAPVDVARLLSDLHALLAPKARDQGLGWTLDMVGLPARLWTDARALRQVLLNLLGNALKYTPEGGVRLVARWEACKTGSANEAPPDPGPARIPGHLRLDIVDTGLGMDKAQQVAAFEPGVRWHPEQAEGQGLGLAVVQAWVRRLGVNVVLDSAPGQGTTVHLDWPMASATAALRAGRSCPD